LIKTLTYLLSIALIVLAPRELSAQVLTLQSNQPSGCAPHGVIITASMSDGSAVGATAWAVTGPNGIVLQSNTNPYVAIFNTPGTYDISITLSSGPAQVFDDFITVFAKPSAAIALTDSAGCLPFCAEFADASTPGSGPIVEWSWDFGDGAFSEETNPNHCYAQAGNFTPVLSIADANGCFSSISIPQLIQASSQHPQANFTVGSQSTCSLPTTINFSASQVDYSNYTWSVNAIETNQNTAVASIAFNESATYSVCLAVENTIGCVDTTCRDVSISSQPMVGFITTADTTCAGQTLQFTNITNPAPTSVEWDYNADGATDGTGLNGSFTFSAAGTPIIRMVAHFGSACSMAYADTLTVMPNPTIDFSADITSGCSVPLEVHFSNGASGQINGAFTWFVNNEEVSSEVNLTQIFTSTGNYDIRLRRISESGCIRNRTRNNYIHIETPSLSFEHEEAICTGETMEVTDIVLSPGGTIVSYSWDFNGDGIEDATGANPDFVFNESGEFFPILSVTTADGCTATATSDTALSVLEPALPGFTVNQTLGCAGISFEFCIDYQPGNTYIWDFHDGSGPQTMQEEDSCYSRMFEDTGFYDVSLAILNGACNVSATREDYIHVVPPLALFSFEMTCAENGVQFTNESIEGDSLVWDFGDGSPLVINVANPTHHYDEPGQYTVTLEAHKNGDSCSDSKTENIIITSPSARIAISPEIGCSPLEVHIENIKRNVHWELNVENGDQVIVDRVYNPSVAPWTIVYTHNGQSETTYSNDPMQFEWPTLLFEVAGTYDIQVSATNYQGCTADTTYLNAVTVLRGGEFSDFTYAVADPCANGSVVVSFEATSPQASTFNWAFSDGASSALSSTEHAFAAPFNYASGISATLTASNVDGCSSARTIAINTTLPPQAQFQITNPQVCRGEVVVFNNTSIVPQGTQFNWSFGDNSSAYLGETAQHAYPENGSYQVCLTATNAIGCSSVYCHPTLVEVLSPDAQAAVTSVINNCLYTVSFDNTSTGSVAQTHWNFGDSQTGLGYHVAHTYPIGVFDAVMITVAQNGCADTLSIPDVLNYSSSVGPFNQTLDSATCAPFDVSFEAFNVSDNSFQYFWDFNDGQGDPFGGTTTAHTYTEPGEYCPSIIMTDQNGCDVYIHCVTPIVVENYQAHYSVPEHICEGDLIEITSLNAENISWNSSQPLSNSVQPNVAIMTAESTTDVVITSNYSDCISTDTLRINVLPRPSVSLQFVDSICFNSGLVAMQGGNPAGATGHYFVNSIEAATFNSNHTPNSFQRVEYRYMDDAGCMGAAIDSVFILPLPVVESLIQQTFCDGDQDYAFVLDSMVQSHYTVDGAITGVFTPVYSPTPYAVVLHFYDNHGCYASSSTEFVVHPKPQLELVSTHFCTGQEIQINANATVVEGQITEFEWQVDGAAAGSTTNLNGVIFEQGGHHNGLVDVASNYGCAAQQPFEFMVYDTPNASFSMTNACEKDSALFVDESSFGNDSIVGWLWFAEGNQWIDDDTSYYIFNNNGAATVALHITTAHGCSGVSHQQINVRPMPQITFNTDDHCLGLQTAFIADVALAYGGITSTTWSIEGYPFTSVGFDTEYLFDSAGVFNYAFTAISNYGCRKVAIDSVEVYPLPIAKILNDNTEFCNNQSIGAICESTIAQPSFIESYQWFLDNEAVSNANPAHFTLSDIGAYNLDVLVRSNRGCMTRASMDEPLIVYPSPTAGFNTMVDQSTSTPTIVVTPQTSPDVTITGYNWGDNTEGSEIPQHTYAEDGVYEITQVVTNAFGCTAEYVQSIEASNSYQFYIPSAFSPDNNNHNELFLPVITGSNIALYTFRIYNRWGIEVFSTHTIGEGWDGTFNNQLVEDGVYVWSVDMIVRGRPELINTKGSVTLLR
jgi:gliding motility-associated-like protein